MLRYVIQLLKGDYYGMSKSEKEFALEFECALKGKLESLIGEVISNRVIEITKLAVEQTLDDFQSKGVIEEGTE